MDIVTLAAARKGGSGGDVTKDYVDEHLVLKVDKVEGKGLSTNDYTNADKSTVSNSPIADTTTGINPSIIDSADGYVQSIIIYGRTDIVEGELHGIGEDGELEITTANSDNTASTIATVTTQIPLCGVSDTARDKLTCTAKSKQVETVCGRVRLADLSWLASSIDNIFYTVVPNALPPIEGGRAAITSKYIQSYSIVPAMENKTFVFNNLQQSSLTGILYIKDTDYITVSDFVASLGDAEFVYELAESVITPLTTAEISALRNLRTYNPTTNVTITDAPTVDVGYLLDTDNGKAIGQLMHTFSEMVLFETDLDTGTQITLNATITLSQPFTNFDEIVIEWGYKSNNYYEVFSNSFRSAYFSQMKRYKENHSSTQVEINLNYFNGGVYTCFIPTADDKLYITAIGGSVSRYITKIIGRKYNTA